MTMEALPPEILHTIFSWLAVITESKGYADDLYNLRLVNRSFALIGESHVAYDVFGSCNHFYCDRAIEEAQHAKFGVNTIGLIVNPSRLDEHLSFESWRDSREECFDQDFNHCPVGVRDAERPRRRTAQTQKRQYAERNTTSEVEWKFPSDERRAMYKDYKRHFHEENDEKTRFECWERLGGAFSICPKLSKLIVMDGYRCKTFDSQDIFAQYEEPGSWPFRHYKASYAAEAAGQLLHHIAQAKRSLTFVALLEVSYSLFLDPRTIERFGPTFAGLREARVLIDFEDEDLEVVQQNSTVNLINLLQRAPHLELLKLGSKSRGLNPPQQYLLLDAGFSESKWPHLQTLAIRGIRSTEDDLVRFLQQHSSTLVTILFRDVYLEAGTWTSLLRRTSKMFPQLQTFRVYGFLLSRETAAIPNGIEYHGCTLDLCDQYTHAFNKALHEYMFNGGPNPPPRVQTHELVVEKDYLAFEESNGGAEEYDPFFDLGHG